MLSLFILILIFFNGFVIYRNFIPNSKLSHFSSCFLIGSVFSIILLFLSTVIIGNLDLAITFFTICSIIILLVNQEKIIYDSKKLTKNKKVIFINAILLLFFFLLFEKSFSYDRIHNLFLIQSNLYQDFGAHIPFIRAFSIGNVVNPEVSFYAGSNLFYHFLFDFYAAILERYGIQINYAVNILSSIALISLFNLFKSLSKLLFYNVYAGIFCFLFIILGTDLSAMQLLNNYDFSPTNIYHHNTYIPVDFFGLHIEKYFLNINVFLNQRHLLFGLLTFFTIAYLILENDSGHKTKKVYLLSFILGVSCFWHIQTTFAAYIFLFGIFLLLKEKRKIIVKVVAFSLIISVPQLLIIKLNSLSNVIYNPGFLVSNNLNILSFSIFWIFNLGLLIPLGMLGFIKSNKLQKSVFIASLSLFIIPNLLQFSSDMFDNHKFFNIWIVFLAMVAGSKLYYLLNKNKVLKAAAILLFLVTISTGIFHVLVVKNDVYVHIEDIKNSEMGKFIRNNLTKDAIVLSNAEIYDPVSLIGIRTYIGRPRYIYLYGGDPDSRTFNKKIILAGDDTKINNIIKEGDISHLIIYKGDTQKFEKSNIDYLSKKFKIIYEDHKAIIYKT